MKFKLASSLVEMTGTAKNSQLVYYMRGNEVIARARVTGANPKSPEQMAMRLLHKNAVNQWGDLSDEVRDAWEEWAKRWHTVSRKTGKSVIAMGRSAFISAARQRLLLELPAFEDAPVPLPAPQIVSAVQVATGDPHRFDFQINSAPDPAGSGVEMPALAIVARITPATPGKARKPYPKDLRMIAGTNKKSTCILPAGTSATVSFEDSRFEILEGQRYGFELTPVRIADGVPGRFIFGEAKKA